MVNYFIKVSSLQQESKQQPKASISIKTSHSAAERSASELWKLTGDTGDDERWCCFMHICACCHMGCRILNVLMFLCYIIIPEYFYRTFIHVRVCIPWVRLLFLVKSNIVQDPKGEPWCQWKQLIIASLESGERVEQNKAVGDTIPCGSWVMPLQNCTVYTGSNNFFKN